MTSEKPVIIAIDEVSLESAVDLVSETCSDVSGFKIGLPFILDNGLKPIRRLRALCGSVLWIADLKLADIAHVMKTVVRRLAGYFDAIIAHSFVGYEGALDELAHEVEVSSLKLILVATMSHRGAQDYYDCIVEYVPKLVAMTRAWGVVAPATRPWIIKQLRSNMPSGVRILAPGVGYQGARPGEALCSGADFEIVGRLITASSRYKESLRKLVEEQQRRLEECRRAS